MKNVPLKIFARIAFAFCLIISTFGLTASTAEAGNVTVTTVVPNTTIPVGTAVTFRISDDDLVTLSYLTSDSLPQSTISNSNINVAGYFNWTPQEQDIGTHTLTITTVSPTSVRNTFTVVLTVTAQSGLSIVSVSPGASVFPDNVLSFGVTASGYSNPTFTIADSFSGGYGRSSVSSANIDSNGNFAWKPAAADVGLHNLSIRVRSTNGREDSVYLSVTVNGVLLKNISLAVPEQAYANNLYTFYTSPYGLNSPTYQVTDSLRSNTIDTLTIDGNKFNWTPTTQDIGLHTLTITGSDGTNVANATFKLNVIPTISSSASVTSNANTTANTTNVTSSTGAVKTTAVTASTQTSTTASAKYVFKNNLSVGSKGKDVTELQKLLKLKGIFSATPNGVYGPATKAAVIKYQAAHGIAKLGIVGPATRISLNK